MFEYHAYHKRDNWSTEKQAVIEKLLEQAVKTGKVQELEQIVGLSLDGLKKYLARMVLRETEITAKDAKLLSDIIANIDRISRLENNKPTEVKRYEHMTPDEIRKCAQEIVDQLRASDPLTATDEPVPPMITASNYKMQ